VRTVFFDVDTQLDFVFPAGALYIPGAERVLPNIARLNAFAAASGDLVISTMDAHSGNDREFAKWPPHCVAGTLGQRKPDSTLLQRRVVVPSRRSAPVDLRTIDQLLLEKQVLDCFTNPNLNQFLTNLAPSRYVVYGVVTEICVKCALAGLQKMDARVELVTDAVKELDVAAAGEMIREFTSAGVVLTTTEDVLAAAAVSR
jgi:nicotinamidase/pyrazinamidase